MAKGTLYNFMWIEPQGAVSGEREIPVALADPNNNNDKKINCINIPSVEILEGIILYPALLTPGIVCGNEKINLFLLVKKQFKLSKHEQLDTFRKSINLQLKVSKGIHSSKYFSLQPLFKGTPGDNQIKITEMGKLPDDSTLAGDGSVTAKTEIFKSGDKRGAVILDEQVIHLYRVKEFKYLYCLEIDNACLKNARGENTYYASGNFYHRVKPGDNLKKIAEKYGFAGDEWKTKIWTDPKNKALHTDAVITDEKPSHEPRSAHRKFFTGSGYVDYNPSAHDSKPEHIVLYVDEAIFIPDNPVVKKQGKEKQDDILRDVVKSMNGDGIKEDGLYGFSILQYRDGTTAGGKQERYRDINVTAIDKGNPLQAYHPLFYYSSDTKVFNIGHVTDIHLCSRQQLLSMSNARVIEDESDLDFINRVSPELGTRVNSSSKNSVHMFDMMGRDSDVDIIALTGDIIDFVPGYYTEKIKENIKIKEIWEELTPFGRTYRDFVDHISVYSIILDFYTGSNAKPVFYVSGNHDTYNENFGISPRVFGIDSVRANENIPADHNLTFYEAILIFGEGFQEADETMAPRDAFYRWIHAVYTPFSDYYLELPKQTLGGFGWGNTEEKITWTTRGDQGFGHLPRADAVMTSLQHDLLDEASRRGKKIAMMSHFTIVSFKEDIPVDPALRFEEREPIPLNNGEAVKEFEINYGVVVYSPSFYDYGTFEDRRKKLYKDYLGNGADSKISCVFTGHSHRRGLYTLKDAGTFNINCDFFDIDKGSITARPAIVVSDCGGPIPRCNMKGEFNGWGSAPPTGSVVRFDSRGMPVITRLIKVPFRQARPRFVVALDYFDLLCEERYLQHYYDEYGTEQEREATRRLSAIEKFESVVYDSRKPGKELEFNVTLHKRLQGIEINRVYIYRKDKGKNKWEKVEIMGFTNNKGKVDQTEIKTLNGMAKDKDANDKRRLFIAVQFKQTGKSEYQQYDFNDYWTYECQLKYIEKREKGKYIGDKYKIFRDKEKAEIVQHNLRTKKEYGKKYA